MSTCFGYALFSDNDDEMFIGTVIKGLRRKCSVVWQDHQSDNTFQGAINLAAHIMANKIDELWLIAPDRIPTGDLIFSLTDDFLEDAFNLVFERLQYEFEYDGYIPLCFRNEKDGDSEELIELQKSFRNNLKSLLRGNAANLPDMIAFEKQSENLAVHYLFPPESVD
ncbi:MAG: hypothetical protein J0L70_30730 [Leptolyngbya sp. UWPOB_LEPTO1]|uniref:hypothetical protein n=1 Tax=Leptolyngbya sp. UWPOB_LEPTO1 TaxID=2815653 RepID=UPI001AD4FE69|nr:hypothetical protein [Leptolyngbya sp. UWPOB_LEPTO1]MBN8564896.1 hypothetical protein [Leptolyngbya sp. UWPOB_LEPTO1]